MRAKNIYIIWFLIYKNLQIKYKQTALGFIWSLLHPALYLLIFITIFSNVFNSIQNYPLYVLSGLVFWLYFSEGSNRLSQVFIKNTHMIKCLGISKAIYAIAELGSELVSFTLGLIPFLIIMFFMGLNISLNLLFLIPIIILFSIFIFSIGIILGSLNVFFRDVGILWLTLNPAIFYITPIAFSYNIVPEKFKYIISYNPLYHFLEIIRDVLYYNQPPSITFSINAICITLFSSLIALFVYKKTRNSFISNI